MGRNEESIYSSTLSLDAAFSRLARDERVLPENKLLITKFANAWLAKGFTKVRVAKLVYCMRKLSAWFGRPFEGAAKDDLMALVGTIEATDHAENSKYDFKVVLKMFYKWFKGDDEQMPREVAWLKPRVKTKGHKLPEQLLTEDDVLKMASAANNPRDKALVLVLYESGCRIGELLSLRIKNVLFDQHGAILRVTGKTGDRRVRIISSAPALTSWLDNYEGAKDPEAALWPARSNRSHEIDLCALHKSIYETLKRLARSAGINKKIYPHLFRHSRATFLASKLTEAQMKEYFGWVQGSDMASVYVHLSGRDVDNALLSLQGLATIEEKKEDQMKLCFCQRCKEKNSPASKFCSRCGTPMDERIVEKIKDENKTSDNLLNQLMQNAEFKEFMFKKVMELGLSA
ncbi:tyrosine-type recombinase/integrase [Candidatus Micrarchaeota archaeon]|nr:tyrosine-type recombinase/integrase [Candidatus Micrarchaeota archaeon]